MHRLGLTLTLVLALVRLGPFAAADARPSSADRVEETVGGTESGSAAVAEPSAPTVTEPASGTVAVYVDGVQPSTGDVVVRLFRTGDEALRQPIREVRLPARARALTAIVDDVPAGPVSVVVALDAAAASSARRVVTAARTASVAVVRVAL